MKFLSHAEIKLLEEAVQAHDQWYEDMPEYDEEKAKLKAVIEKVKILAQETHKTNRWVKAVNALFFELQTSSGLSPTMQQKIKQLKLGKK